MTASEAGRVVDGRNRVTGALSFVNDVVCEDALHVAFTLSSRAHARLASVDLGPALAVPGVVGAVSGPMLGARRVGRIVRDYPVLAPDRVLYIGERIAAIAAIDRETARHAADLVEIDYEDLPEVASPDAAMDPGAPVLHPDYESYEGALAARTYPNEQGLWTLSHGDAAAGFRASDDIHENVFTAARSHSAALEPHACLIVPSPTRVDVYSTHKAPYDLRRDLAVVSGRPPEDFAVHSVHIGGDFGSKGVPYIELACYFLAEQTQRPVRCVLSFYEELTATGSRHPTVLRLRTGLREGRMVAHDTDVVLDGGAYAALKAHPLAVVPAIRAPVELYDIPNVDERCRCLYTNSLPGAHVRSPGEFQAAFAGESHIDLIARSTGRDPIEFRLDNTENPTLRRVLLELRAKVDAWRAEARPGTGIGVALCFRDVGPGASTATCRARLDGSIDITVAVPDQGAGSYTVFRRLVADALAVPEERVMINVVGTDRGIADSGAGASRVTGVAGRATVQAANALLEALGGPPSDAERAEENWISQRLGARGLDELEATGNWSMGWPPPPDANIRSYGGVAMEVSVDADTGQFEIHRAFVVADTGVVVHPVAHRGQIEGGFVYGLSQATLEELVVEQGQVVTASLGDYRIMSAADVPPLEVRILETEGDAFTGMRSVGELTNVGGAPALANAIHDAIGVRVRDLPITPERVRRAAQATADRAAAVATA